MRNTNTNYVQKSYDWEFSENNICEVTYTEYYEVGDHFTPPHYSIEIDKITLNGDCVTEPMEVYYDEIEQAIQDNNK